VISKDAYSTEFVHTTPIINGVIKKWKLYKVIIEASIPTKKDTIHWIKPLKRLRWL
jgi:hypothetical protein